MYMNCNELRAVLILIKLVLFMQFEHFFKVTTRGKEVHRYGSRCLYSSEAGDDMHNFDIKPVHMTYCIFSDDRQPVQW